MSDNGDLREDLKIPEAEIGQQLKNEYDAGKELLVRKQTILHNCLEEILFSFILFLFSFLKKFRICCI